MIAPSGPCIYVIRCVDMRKIGISGKLRSRLCNAKVFNPFDLELEYAFAGDRFLVAKAEVAAHQILGEQWVKGEWFRVDQNTAVDAVTRALDWAREPNCELSDLGPPTRRNAMRLRVRAGLSNRSAKADEEAVATGNPRAVVGDKLALAKPLWADPNFSANQVSEQIGASIRSLYRTLGPRGVKAIHPVKSSRPNYAPAGRKLLMTTEKVAEASILLESGLSLRGAAEMLKVSRSTLYRYLPDISGLPKAGRARSGK